MTTNQELTDREKAIQDLLFEKIEGSKENIDDLRDAVTIYGTFCHATKQLKEGLFLQRQFTVAD